MLKITIPARKDVELYDDQKREFYIVPGNDEYVIEFEHSLCSLAKWESKWCLPFLSKNTQSQLTEEQSIDYVRCMSLTPNVPDYVYDNIPKNVFDKIMEYINFPSTATVLPKINNPVRSSEIVTSELIYYWMIALTIPTDYDKWHLNRLMTLIELCNRKNNPKGQMSKKNLARQYAEMNAARRKRYNTRG